MQSDSFLFYKETKLLLHFNVMLNQSSNFHRSPSSGTNRRNETLQEHFQSTYTRHLLTARHPVMKHHLCITSAILWSQTGEQTTDLEQENQSQTLHYLFMSASLEALNSGLYIFRFQALSPNSKPVSNLENTTRKVISHCIPRQHIQQMSKNQPPK